ELDADGLGESDALESILNAREIYKTIRSTSAGRTRRREYLHIIIAPTLDGRCTRRVNWLSPWAPRRTIFLSPASDPHDAQDQQMSDLRQPQDPVGARRVPR